MTKKLVIPFLFLSLGVTAQNNESRYPLSLSIFKYEINKRIFIRYSITNVTDSVYTIDTCFASDLSAGKAVRAFGIGKKNDSMSYSLYLPGAEKKALNNCPATILPGQSFDFLIDMRRLVRSQRAYIGNYDDELEWVFYITCVFGATSNGAENDFMLYKEISMNSYEWFMSSVFTCIDPDYP